MIVRETKQTISHTSAQALFDKMRHLDKELDARVAAVSNGLAAIVAAHESAQELYAKRSDIAKELRRLAPDDFMPEAVAVGASQDQEKRWHRVHPLPPFSPLQAPYGATSEKRAYRNDYEE